MNSEGDRLIELIIDSYTDEYGIENLGNQIIDVINLITRQELKAIFVEKYVGEIIRLNEGVEFVLQNGSIREDDEFESYFEEIFAVLCDFTGYNEAIGLISKIDDRGRCRIDAAKGILKAYVANERLSDDITFNNYQDIFQSILAIWHNEKTNDRMLSNLLEVLLKHSKINEYLTLVGLIKDNKIKYDVLSSLLNYLYKENNLDLSKTVIIESLQCARLILDETIRCEALIEISYAHSNQGNSEAASSVLDEALEYAFEIIDNEKKYRTLIKISNEFSKQGDKIKAITLIQDAIESANAIVDESIRDSTLSEISMMLTMNGEIYKALECIKLIKTEKYFSWLIQKISNEFARQGSFDDAFTCTRQISDINEKCRAFKVISEELFRHGKIHESFQCARGIEREYWKSESLKFISAELFKKGDLSEAKSLLLEAFEYARLVEDGSNKSSLLVSISNEFTRQGMLAEAMESLAGIYDERSVIEAIKKVLNYLNIKGDLIHGERIGDKISNGYLRNIYFKELSKYLIDSFGRSNFLEQYKKIESIEMKKSILTYWVENIEIKELKIDLLCQLIYLSQNEIEVLEKLLQLFALNQIFYNEMSISRVSKFETVLNIKWAIDLKLKLI
jgi:hypothetical protein